MDVSSHDLSGLVLHHHDLFIYHETINDVVGVSDLLAVEHYGYKIHHYATPITHTKPGSRDNELRHKFIRWMVAD
jgi:hypothetical protein